MSLALMEEDASNVPMPLRLSESSEVITLLLRCFKMNPKQKLYSQKALRKRRKTPCALECFRFPVDHFFEKRFPSISIL